MKIASFLRNFIFVLKDYWLFQTKMETMQVFIKTEHDDKEEDTTEQHAHSLAEETTCLEPFKSER
jgi:hypothetical protein